MKKICPKCKSLNNVNFTQCWKCKKPFLSGGLPLPIPMENYSLFDMCPFAIARVADGGDTGFDLESYTWTHSPCMRAHCRLWTYKFDRNMKISAEGCSLQFMGMAVEEIKKNYEIKNKITEAGK